MAGEKLQELVKKQDENYRPPPKRFPYAFKTPFFGYRKTTTNKRRQKAKIGGQKGHKKHVRMPFPSDQFDQFIEVPLEVCPECGDLLHECEEVVTKQQIDIVEKPFIVAEYHCHTSTCPSVKQRIRHLNRKKAVAGCFR
jgi:transposase